MKKAISIFTALTTVLWLSGVAMILPIHAVDLVDGDVAREADEFDVYIIKLVGTEKFKRLILNPDVFNMYGHLEWGNVKVVADGELADYETSELVRADGDEKVYKLYPDGDVGTKKWVESLDCFTSQGFDWDSVYVINTFDRDSYTTAATTLCEEVVAGDITLSLAADTPAAASIPYNAESEPYLKINVAGSGTITQMVFKRTDVGEPNDFNNVYLYEGDERLTSGRSISSSTSKVTFIGLSITAPTTITLVGDLTGSTSTAEAGNINAFSLESASDVTSDATVGGSFPITGNGLTITAVRGGLLTVTKNGSLANPTVGEKGAKLSQFQITTSYEIIKIERLALYNGGTMNSPEITNLELKDAGNDVVATADACGADDICTLVFDSPYEIGKGENEIFKLYGDLAGDKSDTIGLYFEVDADIHGTGQTYGHKAAVTRTTMDELGASNSDCHNLTLQGGELTISQNNPVATDIGENTNDTVMMEFSFIAASDLEIRKMRVYVCWYDADGVEAMATDTDDEILDVKLRDKDTGTILMGPTDGSGFDNQSDTPSVCNTTTFSNGGEMWEPWTDTWDISAGETKNLQLTLDVDADSVTNGLETSDKLGMVLYGYGESALDNGVKYTGTNDYVADADIVPNTNIDGNAMTIQGSSLSVALASIPFGDVDAVKGQTGVTAVAFVFTAGEASDMEVTDLVLTGWVQDTAADGYTEGKTADSLYAKNVISNLTLYEDDGTTKITNGGPKGFTSAGEATFDSLSWTVPAGADKKMIVKGDITTTAASGSPDYVAIEIDAAGDVTAIDDEGNSTTGTASVNSSETVRVVKYTGGTLIATVAPDGIRRDMTYVYQGQKAAEFSKFKLTATREAFLVDKLRIYIDDGATEAKYMSKVELSYPVDAAGTLVSPKPAGYFGSVASVTFDLTGKEMYVPKDDYAYLTVYADLATYINAGDPGENLFGLDFEMGTDTEDFHATGVGSSDVIDGTEIDDSTSADLASAENMYLMRTFPSFTLDRETGGQVPSGASINKVIEFTITNHGDYELVFNGTSGELTFDVLGSGQVNTDATFKLYKSGGTEIDSATATTPGDGASSVSFTTFTNQITIEKNSSLSFYIKISSGASIWDEQGDWLKLRLDNETDAIEWDDGGTTSQIANIVDIQYIGLPMDGPTWNVTW